MALPCSKFCPQYMEGCHKSCSYWTAQREKIRGRSKEIRAYLKASNETTSVIIRQLRSMTGAERV